MEELIGVLGVLFLIVVIGIGCFVGFIAWLDSLQPPRPERLFTAKDIESLRLRRPRYLTYGRVGFNLITYFADSDPRHALKEIEDMDKYSEEIWTSYLASFLEAHTDRRGGTFVWVFREEKTEIIYYLAARKEGMGNYSATCYTEFPEIPLLVVKGERTWEKLCLKALNLLYERVHKFLEERKNQQTSSQMPGTNSNQTTSKAPQNDNETTESDKSTTPPSSDILEAFVKELTRTSNDNEPKI